uniref:Small ribosomal subunit protein bS16m n=1 Tax=Gopherus agassizii TaxID=38772 RepID=A0A452GW24_9SAUR
ISHYTTVISSKYKHNYFSIQWDTQQVPVFHIMAACNKRARDSKYLEQVGCYDPLPNSHNEKLVGLNIETGSKTGLVLENVTKPVEKLLDLSGFFPLHPMTITNAERLRKRRALKAETTSEEETPGDQ